MKTVKERERLLVVDINYVPSEFKDKSIEDLRDDLEEFYGVKVFLVDGSRQNTVGQSNNYNPVYFI